jgi:hypothetical protein
MYSYIRCWRSESGIAALLSRRRAAVEHLSELYHERLFCVKRAIFSRQGCCKVASGESIRRNKNAKPAGAG